MLSQGGIAGRIWNVTQQHGGGPRTVVPIDTLQAHTRRDEANAQVDGIPKGANIAAQSIKLHHPPQQPLPTQPADTQAATLPGGIQKIVHQTWKSKTLYPNQVHQHLIHVMCVGCCVCLHVMCINDACHMYRRRTQQLTKHTMMSQRPWSSM